MPRLMILPVSRLPLGKRWLTEGVRGQDVRQLQMLLSELGLYAGAISGEYDLLTQEAVKGFQKAYCLAVDGVCGPDTCKLLREEGIHNRILRTSSEGETIHSIAEQYGVSWQALKDPSTRRRLRQVNPGQQAMVERREIIFGVEANGPLECPGVETTEGAKIFYVKPEGLAELVSGFPLPRGSSLVVDLTAKKMSRRERKTFRRIRRVVGADLIWWQKLDHCSLPTTDEADALMISLGDSVSYMESLLDWPRQIKKILSYYPCTRLFIHFNLEGKEQDEKGMEFELTPVQRRMTRLNRIGEPKRTGQYGWIYYRYRYKDETRTVFVPDRLTIRGILDQIDRLNLRGAVFTGLDNGWEAWQNEGNRYFLATPRIMVMKQG